MYNIFQQGKWHRNSVNGTYDRVLRSLQNAQMAQQLTAGESMSRLRNYNAVRALTPSSNDLPCYTARDRGLRAVVAKLRSGTLPLAIETGRYTQTPREERLCRSCNANLIEDEMHFIFDCEKYDDIRRQFILVNTREMNFSNNSASLNFLMADLLKCKYLARYILAALRLRRQ